MITRQCFSSVIQLEHLLYILCPTLDDGVDFLNLAPSSARIYAYRQVCNIRCTLVGNLIIDHSDVVGVLPFGAAPTASSFSA